MWVKTTEFKGGAVGGPPLATNHDVKAVEYLLKYKLSQMAAEAGFEGLMPVGTVFCANETGVVCVYDATIQFS